MAADLGFEGQLRGALRASLGTAEGPHPTWVGSPAAGVVADFDIRSIGRRRPSRLLALFAAAAAVALLGIAVIAGGAPRLGPGPQPTNGIVVPILPSPTAGTTPAVVAPSPTVARTEAPCVTTWSHFGTQSPKGLVDGIRTVAFDAYDGRLAIVFGHALDTVRAIVVAPANPPFGPRPGRPLKVLGNPGAFLTLTITGLTRPTTAAPPDMRYDRPPQSRSSTVGRPILEMRRTTEPRSVSPLVGPDLDSTEIWIIGLDHPACLTVTTMHLEGYGSTDPGDNALVVDFG